MEAEYRQEVIGLLNKAFKENRNDPVSLVTIIDMYGNEFNEDGSTHDIEIFLKQLAESLKSDPPIVKEIGWDLPKLLLQFFNTRTISTVDNLENNEIIINVIKCMNEIAENGNPKECLLACSDILNELEFPIEELEETSEVGSFNSKNMIKKQIDFIPNMKMFVLFQLTTKILNNIDTLYPSKFVAIFISSLIKCLKKNQDIIESTDFVLSRIYEFAINYKPNFIKFSPELQISENEYEEVVSDEKELINKLIREVVTLSLSLILKNKTLDLDLQYYNAITGAESSLNSESGWLKNISTKFNTLGYGLDIDIGDEFTKYLSELDIIYKPVIEKQKDDNEADKELETQAIYQLSYTYSINKMLNKKELDLDPYGIIILSGLFYVEENKHILSTISIKDAVCLFLSITTASLFSENFNHKAVESICRYWLWVAVTTTSTLKLKEDFRQLPTVIVKTFLQMLLLKNCLQKNDQVKNISFTLLTRILCLLPEDNSFEFIIDTLLTCPYTNAKIVILKILKELMQKHSTNMDDQDDQVIKLVNNVKDMKLDVNERSPPSLPPRPYITLDDDRMASLHSLVMLCIDQVVAEKDMDAKKFQTLLLCYMNFFVSLRYKWNKDLLHDLMVTINDKVIGEVDHQKTQNELQFISIANETIKGYLDQ